MENQRDVIDKSHELNRRYAERRRQWIEQFDMSGGFIKPPDEDKKEADDE